MSKWKYIWAVVFVTCLAPDFIFPKTYLVYDDRLQLDGNAFVQTGDYFQIWTTSYWQGVEANPVKDPLYRPIFSSLLSLFLHQPGILRLTVVLSHFLFGLLLWFALKERTGANLAFLGAAIFLFHPANAEVTGQIVGLQETMSALLGSAGLIFILQKPRLAIFSLALAPGFKESGFIWLILAAVRAGFARKTISAVSLSAVFALWMALRFNMQKTVTAAARPYRFQNPLGELAPWDAFVTKVSLLGHQLRLSVWPANLSSDYGAGDFQIPARPWDAAVVAVLAFAAWLYWKRKHVTWENGAALLSVTPTLHLVAPVVALFAERFGYGFRWGLAGVMAAAAAPLYARSKKLSAAVLVAGSAATLIFAGLYFERQRLWSSSLLLFSKDAQTHPLNPKTHFNFGMALADVGRYEDAAAEFTESLKLAPEYSEAHVSLGLVYHRLNRSEDAREHWLKAKDMGNALALKYLSGDVPPR